MATGKDLQNPFKACEDQGFQVERTKRGHRRVWDETGRPVTTFGSTSTSPSGWRNGLAHLKRAGLIWPPASR